MIRDLYNLKCGKGHHHYSPTPEKFVGMSCGYPMESTAVTGRTKRCDARMKLLKRQPTPEPDGYRIGDGGRVIATSR